MLKVVYGIVRLTILPTNRYYNQISSLVMKYGALPQCYGKRGTSKAIIVYKKDCFPNGTMQNRHPGGFFALKIN